MSIAQRFADTHSQLQPDDPAARLFLFGFRQMGANGLDDACVAHSFVTAFGKDFRRPLILLRSFMMELSRASVDRIQIAPWCCSRLTPAEAGVLSVLRHSTTNERTAGLLLADLLGTRNAAGPLASATALAMAFADLGMPLNG